MLQTEISWTFVNSTCVIPDTHCFCEKRYTVTNLWVVWWPSMHMPLLTCIMISLLWRDTLLQLVSQSAFSIFVISVENETPSRKFLVSESWKSYLRLNEVSIMYVPASFDQKLFYWKYSWGRNIVKMHNQLIQLKIFVDECDFLNFLKPEYTFAPLAV
jgi:hypothetical protein